MQVVHTIAELRRAEEVHGLLTATALRGEGLAGVAGALAELLARPVLVEDVYGNPLADVDWVAGVPDTAADVTLDGEVVALDTHGVPSFEEIQNRAAGSRIQFWAFDILYLDGRSLLRVKYRDRRRLLETLSAGTGLLVPALLDGDGAQALADSRRRRWEGVVAKKWESTYQPGRRSAAWIKDKNWNTQEAVIGGWRAGEGGRSGAIGSLLLGIPDGAALRFIGRVGTGFSDRELARLTAVLAPLRTEVSPFDPPLSRQEARGVTYVRPELVGEVRYGELTSEGRLRHPSWRGLRTDKTPAEVVLSDRPAAVRGGGRC